MVTKIKKSVGTTDNDTDASTGGTQSASARGPQLADMVRESAQQIWQAGLGAFAKAQAEGSKAFEALVKEGSVFQRKTQAAAEEKVNDATSRMSSMASDISARATGQWDKLESIFEERVAKALQKLGVPSAKDVQALTARVDDLHHQVQALAERTGSATPARRAAKVARKAPARAATKATPGNATATPQAPAKRKSPVRTTARKTPGRSA